MPSTAAVMPRVDLLKVGNGNKLHIPSQNNRPLCENERTWHPTVKKVYGDGVTCRNCLKQAEKIAAYL